MLASQEPKTANRGTTESRSTAVKTTLPPRLPISTIKRVPALRSTISFLKHPKIRR
jgi:hypothetical protein